MAPLSSQFIDLSLVIEVIWTLIFPINFSSLSVQGFCFDYLIFTYANKYIIICLFNFDVQAIESQKYQMECAGN